jgi:outer membrane protein assembly factor BamB
MRMIGAACLLSLSASLSLADWPQFLGPERDGRSSEAVAKAFPDDGPRVVWKTTVGSGLAGPAVADGRVVLFHREGGQAVLEAWSAADGAKLWRQTVPTDYRDDFGFDDGPRSTPTISGGKVVAYGADGRLICVEAATGKLLWTRDLATELDSPKGWFGRACAPLVVRDLVIVQAGGRWQGKPAGVAAFRLADGAVAWTGSEDEASYSSPVLARFTAGESVVAFTRAGVELLDPANGTSLAREAFEPDIAASVSACTPLPVGDNRFFLSGCYGLGAKVWEVGAGFALKTVWAKTEAMDCHYGTPVFHAGHLYGFHGRQEEGQELRCVSAADGAVKWSARLPAGSLVSAAGTLVIVTEKGELILAPATPDGFKPTARGQILAATARAYPALSDGLLFARDGKSLVAVRVGTR